MPIPVRCSHCGRGYSVRDDLLGSQVKCQCGRPLLVREPAPPPDPLSQLAAWDAASLPASPAGQMPRPARLQLPPRAKKQAVSPGLVAGIGGGAVVMVLIAGVMIAWLVRSSRRAPLAAAAPAAPASGQAAGRSSPVSQGEALAAPVTNQQPPLAPAGPVTLANYSGINCFAVSNDATRIATYAFEERTSGNVHTLKLWDLQTGQPMASMPCPKHPDNIVLSPACDYLATRDGIWSTETATLHHKLDGLDSHRAIGFTRDGASLVLWNQIDEAATVDVATGQVQKMKYGSKSIFPLDAILSPVEPVLVVGKTYRGANPQGQIRAFAMVEFHRLGVVEKAPAREAPESPLQLAFSRDGSLIACALVGGTITVRDPKLWLDRFTMVRPPQAGGEKFIQFSDLALSPSGKSVAVIADVSDIRGRYQPRLELWNLDTRQITQLIDDRAEQVFFLPDGSLVASQGNSPLKFFDSAGKPVPPPGSAGP